MKTIAYIRVSTDKQTSENQRNEISRYAVEKNITIDNWLDFEVSSRKSDEERGINKLLDELQNGDTLIVSELSRLGRSTVGVLTLIDKLNKKGVITILLRQNLTLSNDCNDIASKMMITLFSMFAEMERDIISARTKEALASKKGVGVLGHKAGVILKSEYDKVAVRIIELRELGLSFNRIVCHLGFGSTASLTTYFKKRFEKNLIGGYSIKRELSSKYLFQNGAFRKK